MNRRGFELAIGTLVLLILGVMFLIGLIYILTDGFSTFSRSTNSFLDSSEASAVQGACRLACESQNRFTYCCREFKVNDANVTCSDARLEMNCPLACDDFSCI